MAEECVFCRIATGAQPSRMVYEDEDSLAFLDINPLARGHTVVIPKTHHETLGALPAAEGAELFGTLHRLVPAVERAVAADGSTVGFNNGRAAGQAIPHVHGHIVPRFEGDGGGSLHSIMGSPVSMSDEDLDAIAETIVSEL